MTAQSPRPSKCHQARCPCSLYPLRPAWRTCLFSVCFSRRRCNLRNWRGDPGGPDGLRQSPGPLPGRPAALTRARCPLRHGRQGRRMRPRPWSLFSPGAPRPGRRGESSSPRPGLSPGLMRGPNPLTMLSGTLLERLSPHRSGRRSPALSGAWWRAHDPVRLPRAGLSHRFFPLLWRGSLPGASCRPPRGTHFSSPPESRRIR